MAKVILDDSQLSKPFLVPICKACVFYKDGGDGPCSAFPQGIPEEILKGKIIHTYIHPSQVGEFVFTPPIQQEG